MRESNYCDAGLRPPYSKEPTTELRSACGSLVAAWYLGDLPQSDHLAVITALHRAFLTLGGLTIVSSLSFWTLRARDGESVSRMAPDLA
jgi:hypothetical protein